MYIIYNMIKYYEIHPKINYIKNKYSYKNIST